MAQDSGGMVRQRELAVLKGPRTAAELSEGASCLSSLQSLTMGRGAFGNSSGILKPLEVVNMSGFESRDGLLKFYGPLLMSLGDAGVDTVPASSGRGKALVMLLAP